MKVKFTKQLIGFSIFFFALKTALAQAPPIPNQAQIAWHQAELGAVFHYDLHVFDNKKYVQSGNQISPVVNYQQFNPKNLDTDQWIKAIKDAGFTFAIITATHETGFALYPSEVYPFNVRSLNWKDGKGDIVGDFIKSCRKYGIKPGVYLGIRWNSFYGVSNFLVNGEGEFQKRRQLYYNQMVEGMVKEICTKYGELFEIWFDGGASSPDKGAPDVLPIVKKYQPNCLFYHNNQLAEARWGGSESGTVPYPCWSTFPINNVGDKIVQENNFELLKYGDPNGRYYMPAMADAPLRGHNGRHEWFWEPGDEENIYPLQDLMDMYYRSVGHNATLIMGLTPDTLGLLPTPDVNRLLEWGNQIKKEFGSPIAETSGSGGELILDLKNSNSINCLVIQEDIVYGQRIREYVVEQKIGRKWQEITRGTSIGNKRIEKISPIIAKSLRIRITNSVGIPKIKRFAVY